MSPQPAKINCVELPGICQQPLQCHLNPPSDAELAGWETRITTPDGRPNPRSLCTNTDKINDAMAGYCLPGGDLRAMAQKIYSIQIKIGAEELVASYCFRSGLCSNNPFTAQSAPVEAEPFCDSEFAGWREFGFSSVNVTDLFLTGQVSTVSGTMPTSAQALAKLACAQGIMHCDAVVCKETYCRGNYYRKRYGDGAPKPE